MIQEILHNLDMAWRGALLLAMLFFGCLGAFMVAPALVFSPTTRGDREFGCLLFLLAVVVLCSLEPTAKRLF
jgi:hypothetical protein